MKDRILNNWTFVRVFYLGMGLLLVIQSILNRLWFGVLIGIYFSALGFFAIGCAAGNCYSEGCKIIPKPPTKSDIDEVTIKEVR